MNHQQRMAQWEILDKVLFLINTIDTEGLTSLETKKQIYHKVFEMRPG